MVRRYHPDRPVPPEVVDRIVENGLRAPSAGFSQGWGFLILDTPADVARFRDAVRPDVEPERWFAANVHAPLLIVPHSHKDAYLAALLMLLTAVDADLGACFFGIPPDRVGRFREAFGVPPQFAPIGAISVGYGDEPPRDLRHLRRPSTDVVHRGRWSQPDR